MTKDSEKYTYRVREFDSLDGDFIVIDEESYWSTDFEPGSPGHFNSWEDYDYGQADYYYVRPMEGVTLPEVPTREYRVEVTLYSENATDWLEREVAGFCLLEETHPLMQFQKL